jgi:hypothetical protein
MELFFYTFVSIVINHPSFYDTVKLVTTKAGDKMEEKDVSSFGGFPTL